MSHPAPTAAVVTQAVATATITTGRGTSAAVLTQDRAVATVAAVQGPAGPPGPPGIAAALVVAQTSPSASWVIPHALGRRPLVQVCDPSGEVVFPDVIAGAATVSVIFAAAATGSIILF